MALPLAAIGLGASALQGIIGGVQALTSGARKNQRELEKMAGQSPTYSGSSEIQSYYDEALRRYQQSPYQSAKFIMGRNMMDRGIASSLNALTQRNQALGAVGRLAAGNLDASNRLIAQAEEDRRRDFGVLGQAGRTLAQDKLTQFDINQMTPYNRKFGLQQMKTQAANDRKNAGLQMVGSALGNAASIGMAAAGSGTDKIKPDYTLSTIQSVPTRNMNMPSAPTSVRTGAKPLPLFTNPVGYGVLSKFKKQPLEI